MSIQIYRLGVRFTEFIRQLKHGSQLLSHITFQTQLWKALGLIVAQPRRRGDKRQHRNGNHT